MNQDVTRQGYTKETRLINLYKANGVSLLLLIPVIVGYGLPFYLIWGQQDYLAMIRNYVKGDSVYSALTIAIVMVVGIVLHEFIHGLTWSVFAKKGFRSIKFGVVLKMLTPYCHCKEPLTKNQYIVGALAPAVALGFLPALVALATGSLSLLIFAMFFTVAATGDFIIAQLILKEDKESIILDHPSEAGYYVFVKNNASGIPAEKVRRQAGVVEYALLGLFFAVGLAVGLFVF